MWKSTPTAGLEIILNQKPPHIEIQGVAIKSYILIKYVIKNTWDGNAFNLRSASHLLTLKNVAKTISHNGSAFELFECDHLREPFYNWNPPTHDIITIACDNNIDDSLELPDHDFDHDSNDTNAIAVTDGENPQVDNKNVNNFVSGENQFENNDIINAVITCCIQTTQNGLLYSHFKNNWEIIAQKLNQLNLSGALVIRALIFKNKNVLFNHKYCITGTENVSLATIAVTTVLCNWYFNHTALGDTLDCFLGAGHRCVFINRTINIHISSFISILNKIKTKI